MSKSLSIITINYNNAHGLNKTIKSVLEQGFDDYEYIIIDGGSTDKSTSIIKKYANHLTYWVSESDKGIYNAMNKGLKVAAGDYVLFMNSGDSLYNSSVLEEVFSLINIADDLVYGNVMLSNEKNKWQRLQEHPETLPFSFFYNQTICQQACFLKRTLFDNIFSFNEEYKIVADWEFLIYAIYIHKITYKKIDVIIAKYDMQGISSVHDYREISNKERDQTIKKYFPLFQDDYIKLAAYRSKRYEQLNKIEKFPFVRRIYSILFRLTLFFLPEKEK
jgi:glycosyltransferase involved in cell wall biosynthesis